MLLDPVDVPTLYGNPEDIWFTVHTYISIILSTG